jgi:hypothetical protein
MSSTTMGRERTTYALGAAYFAVLSLAFSGPFWLPDHAMFGIAALAVAVAASLALGFLLNVWRAAWLATLVVAAAVAADVLWQVGVIDRSDEREPLPVIAVVLLVPWVVPAVAAVILLGVAARRLTDRLRRRPLRAPGAPPRGATG